MGKILSRIFGWGRHPAVEHPVPGMYVDEDLETGPTPVPVRRVQSITDLTLATRPTPAHDPIEGLYENRRASTSYPDLSPSTGVLPPAIHHPTGIIWTFVGWLNRIFNS